LPAPAGFFAGLRALCDQHRALLLVDEVQTGIGRLGRWFGFQESGVKPEAIAGGLPPGTHGSTFGGNPLASAAARAVLRILDEEDLVRGAKAKGELLSTMLGALAREVPAVCEGE